MSRTRKASKASGNDPRQKLTGDFVTALQADWQLHGQDIGLPPEKWSSLMYGLWPDGGLKNGKEATHCGRDRHEAAAG